MPLILYRADGGPNVGTGHILRALRLARCWSEMAPDVGVILVAHDVPSIRGLVESAALANLEARYLPPIKLEHVPRLIASEFVEIAAEVKPDAIVIDMLDTPAAEMRAVRKLAPTLVSLDDRGDGRFHSDLIVNFLVRDPNPAELDKARALLREGPEYASLSDEFVGVTRGKVEPEVARRVMVSLGGADAAGLAVKVARALVPLHRLDEVDLAVGVAFERMAELEHVLASTPWEVNLRTGIPSLLPLYQAADLAIVAGGITMHEAACCGVPAIAVCQSIDHQLLVAGWLQDAGCMLNLGCGVERTPEEIASAVAKLIPDQPRRQAMSDAGPKVCDGRGSLRTAEAIVEQVRLR